MSASCQVFVIVFQFQLQLQCNNKFLLNFPIPNSVNVCSGFLSCYQHAEGHGKANTHIFATFHYKCNECELTLVPKQICIIWRLLTILSSVIILHGSILVMNGYMRQEVRFSLRGSTHVMNGYMRQDVRISLRGSIQWMVTGDRSKDMITWLNTTCY